VDNEPFKAYLRVNGCLMISRRSAQSVEYIVRACGLKQVYALSFSTDSKGVFYGT
jgi:hypothetical protein